jgi:hypothetical protein
MPVTLTPGTGGVMPALPTPGRPLSKQDLTLLNQAEYLNNAAIAEIDAFERAGADVSELRLAQANVAAQIQAYKAEYFPQAQ